jgi:hypothetical protein
MPYSAVKKDSGGDPLAPPAAAGVQPAIMAIFAVTVLTGSFLLFQIQPLIAKVILPWFGGSAAVWAVCLVFFQSALLLGYLYAHLLATRVSPRGQWVAHTSLLLASLSLLPVYPSSFWKPLGTELPAVRILLLLAATIGLPYFLLASTGPLVQSWFARHAPTASPYRLYALSNLGSLAALLTYPLFVEPRWPTHQQAFGWSAVYALFAGSMALLAYIVRERTASPAVGDGDSAARPPTVPQLALWVALSATASGLLLAVTNHFTHNVAAIPFLWVLPLTLYLLTFIICFDRERGYVRSLFLAALAIALPVLAHSLGPEYANASVVTRVPVFSAGLFLACMFCHGELARRKPAARHLTMFYLMISLGGAFGGILVGLVAPAFFNGVYELHIALGACALLAVIVTFRDRDVFGKQHHLLWPAGAALAAALMVYLGLLVRDSNTGYRIAARNFHGVVRTYDQGAAFHERRELLHGTIIHGVQFLSAERRTEPVSYFGPQSGIGRTVSALRRRGPLRIGVIGLGVATMAAWGRPGDLVRFYELDPMVLDLAQKEFTYLRDSQAKVEIVLGDGRLSLEREAPQNYDVLMLDAFSSDAIPVHLMTVEAFRLYFRHLASDGILVVQASNRFLRIEAMAGSVASALGKHARLIEGEDDEETGEFGSTQVLVASNPGVFAAPGLDTAAVLPEAPRLRPWNDGYSNLLDILQ